MKFIVEGKEFKSEVEETIKIGPYDYRASSFSGECGLEPEDVKKILEEMVGIENKSYCRVFVKYLETNFPPRVLAFFSAYLIYDKDCLKQIKDFLD